MLVLLLRRAARRGNWDIVGYQVLSMTGHGNRAAIGSARGRGGASR